MNKAGNGMAAAAGERAHVLRTLIPARLDRLPWSPFHTLLVIALGVTWILDGLEVTLIGAISGILQSPDSLSLSAGEVGLLGTAYLVGAVTGSLVFGVLTDRYGRRLFFFVTLAIYLGGAFLTAFSWDLWSFLAFRFITGLGIGGEYAAINSAIDELIPARARGQVDLAVNGSYWLGAALGAASTLFFLDPRIFVPDLGWRIGFGIGAVAGLVILFLRRHMPESPRWLVTHGRHEEAERTVKHIESTVADEEHARLGKVDEDQGIDIRPHTHFSLIKLVKAIFATYPRRAALGLALMVAQAFLYNAIFFTYSLVLKQFYQVKAEETGLYLIPFALANVLGVLLLGRLFDTVGRQRMIAATYIVSGLLLAATGYLFAAGYLTAMTQTVLWSVIFFFASPAASAAYLTVSEIFPLEVRALAIAFFFSVGTGVGGVVAPWAFGTLIGTGSPWALFWGYGVAALLMLGAAAVEMIWGVAAERQSLEKLAPPLAAAE